MIPSRWSSALEILRRRQQRVDEERERLRQQCPGALLAPERGGVNDAFRVGMVQRFDIPAPAAPPRAAAGRDDGP